MVKEVEAVSGRDVRLEMEVCSDPIPSKTTWDWGSLRVEAGQVRGCLEKNVDSHHLAASQWARKFKKVQAKKLVESHKSISRKIF